METTKQHLEAINRFLDRLIRRDRGLMLGEWLAFVAASLTVSLAAAAMLLTLEA